MIKWYNVHLRMVAATYVQVPGDYYSRDLNKGMWTPPSPSKHFKVGHDYTLTKSIKAPNVRYTAQQDQETQQAAQETAESLTKIIDSLDGSRKTEVQEGEH